MGVWCIDYSIWCPWRDDYFWDLATYRLYESILGITKLLFHTMLVLFMTFFMVIWVFVIIQWKVYEHFPSVCGIWVIATIDGSPWAKKWRDRHAHPRGFVEYKRRIDALTIDDIIWTPYIGHRVDKLDEEFDDTILFSGYLRWEALVGRHLLKRCLHQYGYVTDIPRSVPAIPSEGTSIDAWWA